MGRAKVTRAFHDYSVLVVGLSRRLEKIVAANACCGSFSCLADIWRLETILRLWPRPVHRRRLPKIFLTSLRRTPLPLVRYVQFRLAVLPLLRARGKKASLVLL